MSKLKMLKGVMISTLYELEKIDPKQHNENGTSKFGNITSFSRRFYRQYGVVGMVSLMEFNKQLKAASRDD